MLYMIAINGRMIEDVYGKTASQFKLHAGNLQVTFCKTNYLDGCNVTELNPDVGPNVDERVYLHVLRKTPF